MAELTVIPVKVRQETGTSAARRLRASGEIPAVIYGHKLDPVWISVETDVVEALLRHGAHGLLELDIAGAKESAIIKDMQWDAIGREILHVDFARVSSTERITTQVAVVLHGIAPGASEGVIDHQMHTIELESPASEILERLEVNVNALQLNQAILVKDLELPANIKALADPDQIVVQIVVPVVHEEAELAGPAEPELIRRPESEGENEG